MVEELQIDIRTDLSGVGEVTWLDVEGEDYLYDAVIDESISITGLLYISLDALGGTYTLTFYFINQYGINLSKTIEIEIMGPIDDDDDDDTDNDDDDGLMDRMRSGNTCLICCGVALLVIILLVLTIVFVRRSSRGSSKDWEE
jgi:hypothetical protein